MCSIIGSNNVNTFYSLFEISKERGTFASSTVYKKKDEIFIKKNEGAIAIPLSADVEYVTAHLQAPTSSQREWNYNTSHPFATPNWLVSHNGVLTNYEELNQLYCPYNENPVDSSTIVELLELELQKSNYNYNEEVKQIKNTVALLKGTFALTIINRKTHNIFICRQGSTLFTDGFSYSSIKFNDEYKEINEGDIFHVTSNGIKYVDSFKSASPFFVL
jgi:glucosamine 6-phosphate synthetase-like amidotransferase/phosphosugar isomerase protein